MHRKKVIIGVLMVSIFMATAFVPMADNLNNNGNLDYIPAMDNNPANKISLFHIKPSGKAYNFNNNGIIFSGNDPSIKLNNRYYSSQWSVLNKNFNREKLKVLGNKMINNTAQSSAVETLKNNNVSVAYIYSFYANSVHASMAIKNLNNSTFNYTVQFNVILPSNNIMELSNNHSINKNFNSVNGITIMNIGRTYNPLMFDNILINPLNSIPSSTMIIKDSNYAVLTMQYHITLAKDETYTIDPAITDASDSSGASNCCTYGNITTGLSTGGCLFDSKGAEVGEITETAQTPEYLAPSGNTFYFRIDSTFSPTSSSYNVNCIEQKMVDNNGGNDNFKVHSYKSYLQDHQKNCVSSMKTDINAAFNFLNVILEIAGVSIPNPFSLFGSGNDVSTGSASNCFEITANAGTVTSPKAGVYWPSISYGYCTHLYGIIPEYHIKNVHEFGDCIDMHFQNNNGGTQNNPYWNYITYTSTFKIINKNLKPVENENGQYETQISETFKLGQYQRSD